MVSKRPPARAAAATAVLDDDGAIGRNGPGPERRAGSMGGRGLNGTATGSSGSNECPWGHPGASLGIWEDHQNSGRFREKNH